ncbi:Uncharacterised protein [Bordetella pertussis]|nr:Uncharacterised protein [Bordetella pertussis]CFW35807.1 Uncharacterised protein [Bordetella pertussis]
MTSMVWSNISPVSGSVTSTRLRKRLGMPVE